MGSILSMIFCVKTNKGQGVLQKFSPEEKNWGRGPGLKFSVPGRGPRAGPGIFLSLTQTESTTVTKAENEVIVS
jgi:hypothetical protein